MAEKNGNGVGAMKDDVAIVADGFEESEQNNDSVINREARRRLEQIMEDRALCELIKDDYCE